MEVFITPIEYSSDGYYEIEARPAVGDVILSRTNSRADTSWVVGGLQPDVEYLFRVRSVSPATPDGSYPHRFALESPFSDLFIQLPTQADTGLCAEQTDLPVSECEALVALYNSTDGDNWTDNTGWLTSNSSNDLLVAQSTTWAINLDESGGSNRLFADEYFDFTDRYDLAVSPDGTLAVTGSGSNKAYLYDVTTGAILATPLAPDVVRAVAFSPDGPTVALGSCANQLRLVHKPVFISIRLLALSTIWWGLTKQISKTIRLPASISVQMVCIWRRHISIPIRSEFGE